MKASLEIELMSYLKAYHDDWIRAVCGLDGILCWCCVPDTTLPSHTISVIASAIAHRQAAGNLSKKYSLLIV